MKKAPFLTTPFCSTFDKTDELETMLFIFNPPLVTAE